ncbi:MAG: hypothetical protein ACJ77N_01710 [Chloroflexota bacterium]
MASRRRHIAAGIGLAALLGLTATGVVLAQTPGLAEKVLTGSDVTIPAGQISHDVYAFGGRVTSNATIAGELVAAGGTIVVNGDVQNDVIATGGQITINGSVGGHVRAAGGQVTVAGPVAKDVLSAGGQTTIASGSTVGGDLIVWGGQLQVDGTVTGSATGTVGGYAKTGSIGGTDTISVTQRPQPQQPQVPFLAASNPVLDAVRQFVAVVVVGLLVLWLWPRAASVAERRIRENPLPSLGWGIVAGIGYFVLVVAIVIVAAIVAFLLAVIGFGSLVAIEVFTAFVSIAALTLAFVVTVGFLADALVALALARFAVGRRSAPASAVATTGAAPDARSRWSDVLPWIVAVAVVVALSALPVVGGIVKLVVVLLGLGAVVWFVLRRPASPLAVAAGPRPGTYPPDAPVTT